MKRQLYLSLVFVIFTVFAMAQSQRMVLLEHFTQASCGPCATYNPQINNLLLANPDEIIAIMYHTSWPGYDPMYNHNTVENGARTSYYNVSSVPNSVLDGNVYNGHPANWNITTVNNRAAVASPCDISIYQELSPDNQTFMAYVLIEATEDIPAGMKFNLAVIEKHVGFASPPGSNGETDFYNVMKKLLPNQTGTTLPAISAGEYMIMEFSWVHQNVYDIDELAAVGFIQNNNTKEVLQSAKSTATPFSAPYNTDAEITAVSNISQNYCMGHIEPKITIRNNGTAALTSLEIEYNINGEGPATYNWAGNLGFLESETISLEPTDFTVMETNMLSVSANNPNGQSDDYTANNVRNIDIEEAPSVSSPVSLILKLDDNPEETSWEVLDSQGTVLYEGSNYTQPGQIIVQQFNVSEADCYTFNIYDEGGDGLTNGGSYKLGYGGNIIFAEGDGFGVKDEAQFSLNLTSISEVQTQGNLRVYPVPASSDNINIELTLFKQQKVSYSLINPAGMAIAHVDQGMQNSGVKQFTLDVSNLQAGIYYLSIISGTEQTIQKIVLINK